MSKAFTRETDQEDDAQDLALPSLPAGLRNYITPQGYRRLQQELKNLLDDERPKVVEAVHWAARNGDRSENGDYIYGKKRLREIDRRIRFLNKRLELAVISDCSVHHGSERVFFGATVHYFDAQGHEHRVRIMGVDEAQVQRQEVSWMSPIAQALLKARVGDSVMMRGPQGAMELEIVSVSYPAASD